MDLSRLVGCYFAWKPWSADLEAIPLGNIGALSYFVFAEIFVPISLFGLIFVMGCISSVELML